MSTRLKVLTSTLGTVIAPPLREVGFAFDARGRAFWRVSGEMTEIVVFQAGIRSFEAWSTVNLGVYHPVLREDTASAPPAHPMDFHCLVRERLGSLRDTLIMTFFRKLITDRSGTVGWWLTTPSDKWRRFSDDGAQVRGSCVASIPCCLSAGCRGWRPVPHLTSCVRPPQN